MAQPLRSSSRYMRQLDSLRAVAAGMVILSHWVPGTETFWFNGHVGVQLFFVISGFLISGILLDARQNAARDDIPRSGVIRRFYIRRLLRIFPLYYATLALTYLVGMPAVRTSIQWHLPYLSNVFFAMRGEWHGEVAHFWSLAVEEQFYGLWPWLIMFAPQRLLLPSVVTCMLSAPLFRWIAGQVAGINEIAVTVLPLSSLDALGIGALFALVQRRQADPHPLLGGATRLALWGGIAGALLFTSAHLLAPRFGADAVVSVFGDSLLALAALGLVYMTATGIEGPIGWVLQWGPLVYLGKVSYGLYVLHFFVPTLTTRMLAWDGVSLPEMMGPVGSFAVNFLVLVLLSSLSWHFFEKPINGFKKYFPYLPTPPSHRRHRTVTSVVPAQGTSGKTALHGTASR